MSADPDVQTQPQSAIPDFSTLFTDGFIPPPYRPYPEGAEILTHKGRCICGKYVFTIKHPALDVHKPVWCNCSYCSIRAAYGIYADEDSLRFESGDLNAMIKIPVRRLPQVVHKCCPSCCAEVYWDGFPGKKTGVNARLLDGFDVDKVEATRVDGRNHHTSNKPKAHD